MKPGSIQVRGASGDASVTSLSEDERGHHVPEGHDNELRPVGKTMMVRAEG